MKHLLICLTSWSAWLISSDLELVLMPCTCCLFGHLHLLTVLPLASLLPLARVRVLSKVSAPLQSGVDDSW